MNFNTFSALFMGWWGARREDRSAERAAAGEAEKKPNTRVIVAFCLRVGFIILFFATEVAMIRYFTARAAAAARLISFWLTVLATFSLTAAPLSARADITPYGDVLPSDPSTWNNSTVGYIGNTARSPSMAAAAFFRPTATSASAAPQQAW